MPFCGDRKGGSPMFQTTTPHFFKIILDNSLCDGQLGIPRKFARDHGNEMSNPVLLGVPSGAIWEVELIKSHGDLWFQNGWKEFADFYSISRGYFLVFEYKGNCNFHVIIFDTSAVEVDYPLSTRHGDKESNSNKDFQEQRTQETEDDVSVEILEDLSTSRKAKGKSQLPLSRPAKMMKINSTCESSSKLQRLVPPMESRRGGLKQENSIKKARKFHPPGQFKAKVCDRRLPNQRNGPFKATGRMKPLTDDEKSNALYRAGTAFKSDNPCFMIAMQPSYIFPASKVHVPLSFARKFFGKDHGNIVLRGLDGKCWSVKYYITVYFTKTSASLGLGWRQFVQDNNLEVGDVCVFELIKDDPVSLKISIFRFVQGANDHQ